MLWSLLFVFVVNNCLYLNRRLFIAFQEKGHAYQIFFLSFKLSIAAQKPWTRIFYAITFVIRIGKNSSKNTRISQQQVSTRVFFTKDYYFIGFTSTSMGNKDSFLPHLGHFPSCCWRISSGGLRSGPSYNMWLHSLQMTRCGTNFSLPEITKYHPRHIYWLLASSWSKKPFSTV